MRLNQINQNNLEIHSNQSHEKEKIQELKKLHESMVEKLSLTSSDRDGENGDEFNSDGLPPSLPSSQTNSPSSTRLLRKTFGPSDDNIGGMNKSKGRGMQAGMISQINKQKERLVNLQNYFKLRFHFFLGIVKEN